MATVRAPVPAAESEFETADRSKDLGLAGLVLLAQFHDVAADAQQLGLKARIISQAAERLGKITLPALSLQSDASHFIVAKVGEDSVLIHDLQQQRPQVLSHAEFQLHSQGDRGRLSHDPHLG